MGNETGKASDHGRTTVPGPRAWVSLRRLPGDGSHWHENPQRPSENVQIHRVLACQFSFTLRGYCLGTQQGFCSQGMYGVEVTRAGPW